VVVCGYILLQSDLNAFVALLNHELKAWRKQPLNHGAFVHVFHFVLGALGLKKQA
jgi:hypothetical protein